MSKGFVVAEEGHVVQVFKPASLAAAGTGDTISMENWGHITYIVNCGIGSGLTLTVGECTAFTGSGRTAVTFRSAQEATGPGDVLDAALAWASTVTIAGTTAATGGTVVIEIDGDELSDGYQFIQLNTDAVGAKILGAVAVLSGGRYQEDITATAIV